MEKDLDELEDLIEIIEIIEEETADETFTLESNEVLYCYY